MADQVFVDPITGLTLGPYAFGVIPAGTASAEFEAEHRYRWGLTGAGHYQTAYVLYTSTDGGLTWATTSTEFTLQVIEPLNPGNDPLFLGQATAEIPTSRLDVAPLRSGCGNKIGIKFQPSLRTGAARETINWKLGVLFNESFQAISLNPDAPTGILSGLGDLSVSEWEIAPTLALGTDEVTLGASAGVVTGVAVSNGGAVVALNQTSSTGALASGQEYIALLSMDTFGDVITTKGAKASAGAAVQPAFPTGNLPIAVVRVPYGGVIATGTLVAVTGRCWVAAATGLTVTVQPGRAMMPGLYLTPGTVQTLTVPDDATTPVYLSEKAVANRTSGILLANVTTSGGAVTDVSDMRTMLYQGQVPRLYATLDADGNTIQAPVLSGASGTLGGTLDAAGQRITGLGLFYVGTDATDAASVGSARGAPVKFPARLMADAEVAWPEINSSSFEADLDGWAGASWAQDAGAALHTAGATDPLSKDMAIVAGVRYRINVEVGGSAGTVTPSIGAVAGDPIAAGAGASGLIIVAAASGTLPVAFTPTTDYDGAVDNIIVTATLYGGATVDGIDVATGDSVVLPLQVDPAEGGKWRVSETGPWVRHPDCANEYYLFAGAMVWIREGATNAKSLWVQTEVIGDIETTPQSWAMVYQVP